MRIEPVARPPLHETVVHMLDATVAAHADREALVCESARLTYRAYRSCVTGLATELAGRGAAGERVAILLPNSLEVCIAMFAAHAAGAIVVPLNPLYTARELDAILADAEPHVLIYDASRGEEIESIGAHLAIAHRVRVVLGDGSLTRWSRQDLALPASLPSADDLAFVQYTGGTTGRSKGVLLTHRAIATNLAQREGLLPTLGASAERILCSMPIFHAYGLTMGLYLAAYCAGALVIMPRYQPERLLELVDQQRITIFPGSPTIFAGLLAHPRFAHTDWSRVHTCYSGSAPLSEETLHRWEAATRAPIYEGFGQTEAGPILTYNPARGVRKIGSVGVVLPDTEVQIVDLESGTEVLGVGAIGEIRARGPQIMLGYRNRPEETAQALREGWLYTGDIGEVDADGYLFIRDRKKDLVIVGGYNVYPREVDDVLFMHPAVSEAAAIGVPDAYRGEVIAAYVVLRQGTNATPEDLREHCERNLAKYKVPVSITILDALPKTTVNKTDKQALRVLARATNGPAASSKA